MGRTDSPKTRGTGSTIPGRFEVQVTESVPDGWDMPEELLPPAPTTVTAECARSVISRNASPDIPFDQSVNPYRGCEHGCIYCYARPSHAYVNLSPGLDFERRLFYKANAAELLEDELRRPGYRCTPINLGANTDPYQPVERKLRVTRALLEVLARFQHPVTLITKGAALVLRDLDILVPMAQRRQISVAVSLTTLDDALKRVLEPRAAGPASRLRLIEKLTSAGIPVTVLVAPVIPFVTDAELEAILTRAAAAGAQAAGYSLLRLPHEVETLFRAWLLEHFPDKAAHVMSLIQQLHGGRAYDPRWGVRHRGQGPYADMLQQRFRLSCRRLGLATDRGHTALDCAAFRVPARAGDQLDLFAGA
ncbi:MAG TPA: PA0069 family radical SAM protein [Acidiferrobacteraceae bacterium]|nr:PA0069 family radical SAM protein [Acidiferrobacteraceae bacterium]